ncbi:MAG: hypothetical protein R3A79_00425 [Nannocystaceae bacterium]
MVAAGVAFGGCATGSNEDSGSATSNGVPTESSASTTGDASSSTTAEDATSGGTTDDTSTSTTGDASTSSTTADTDDTTETSASSEGSTTTGVAMGCGDGIVDLGEVCDDGNVVDGDGCNADCQPSGELLWSEVIGSGLVKDDEAFGCDVDGFGNFYVTGYVSTEAQSRDIWYRKYDDGGAELWTMTVDGPASSSDQGRGIVAEDSELFYVGGLAPVDLQGQDTWLRRHSADGSALWTKTYNGPADGGDIIRGLAAAPNNGVIAVGHHTTLDQMQDMWIRLYGEGGNVVWTRTYTGQSGLHDQAERAAVAADGSIYVVGTENVTGEGYNMWLSKLDPDGNILWTRIRNGPGNKGDYLRGVAVDEDGDAVVCGYETLLDIPWQSWIRRYDPSGDIVWTETYDGATHEGAHCFDIARDLQGDFVITGGELVDGVREVLVRKLSNAGEPRWTTTVEAPMGGADYGRGLAIAPDNSIYVVGSQMTEDARDIWVGRFSQ